jgi:predicted AAA+ superfamily ATPase
MTAALPMTTVIEDIYDMVHSFVVDEDDLDRIPPFVNFLLYKAASIVTVRLRDQLNFEKNTQMLKSLRVFLDRLNTRWLTAGKQITGAFR